MEAAIVLENVTRRFGDRKAVNEISLSVMQSEIFGLLGPNGAGKTTTINLITGLLKRNSGRIEVLGDDPLGEPLRVRRRLGLVPQETNVYQDLSAVDNLWHHAALYCTDLADVPERMEFLLRLMLLWDRRNDAVRTYSGGMKRRLALTRALLHEPRIVLFDEPTLGVDVQGRHALWDHIRQQREAGITFIVSTNDMAEAEALCDRLVILDEGEVIAIGSPQELKDTLGRDIVTLHTEPAISDLNREFPDLSLANIQYLHTKVVRFELAQADQLVGEIVQQVNTRYQLLSIEVARPTLDDVFLHYTGRDLRE